MLNIFDLVARASDAVRDLLIKTTIHSSMEGQFLHNDWIVTVRKQEVTNIHRLMRWSEDCEEGRISIAPAPADSTLPVGPGSLPAELHSVYRKSLANIARALPTDHKSLLEEIYEHRYGHLPVQPVTIFRDLPPLA